MEKKTGWFEKIAYALGDTGGGVFIWTFSSSFLTLYYTDGILLAAGAVGTMMLVMRVLDGFSDIFFGMMLERTSTRIGKARPWFGASMIPLVVSFLLVFNVPSALSGSARMVYVAVTYFLLTVVTYTINNLAYHSMLSRISLDPDDRNVISATRGIVTGIFSALIIVFTTMILASFGGEKNQGAWTKLTLLFGGICLLFQLICFFAVKEKIPAVKTEGGSRDSVHEGFRELFHCKYFYLAVSIFILSYISSGVMTGAAVYYCRDVFGDSNLFGILAIAFLLPGIIGGFFVPALAKKLGKRKLLVAGGIAGIVLGVIVLFFTRNLIVVVLYLALNSLAGAPFTPLMFTFAADIVDHLEKKTGKRWEGLATSANSFGIKVGTGIGSGLIGWVLAFGHYDGALAVQPASAATAEIVLVLVIPLVTGILRTICASMWDLN